MDLASNTCLANGVGLAAGFFGFFRISVSVSLLAPFGDGGWPPPTIFACAFFAAAFGMAFAATSVLFHRFTNVLVSRFPITLLSRRSLPASLLHGFPNFAFQSRSLHPRVSLALRWFAPSALLDPFGDLGLPPPTVFACEILLLRIFALDGRLSGGLSLVLLLCATTFLCVFFPITLAATARLLWLLLSFDGVLRLFGDILVGDLLSRPRPSGLRMNLGFGFNLIIWITIPYGGIVHSRTLSPMGKHSIWSELEPRAK